jgi:phage-related baseplate assembly protein
LLESLRSTDIEASTCEEAYAAVYATPDAGALLDQIAATTEVQRVIVGGDTATITWSAETNGRRVPVTSTMRRVDGEWKLVDVD